MNVFCTIIGQLECCFNFALAFDKLNKSNSNLLEDIFRGAIIVGREAMLEGKWLLALEGTSEKKLSLK